MESRWMKFLSICSVEIQCCECRYHFALDAVRKIESRSMSSCCRWTLALWRTVLFFNGLFEPFWEEEESTLRPRLLVSDIHNTRHPPRHPMLSPREILFSFPEVQSASPTSFVVVHRLHLVSWFSLTLPPFNPTQLSALWKVSQRDRLFFRVLFVFPRAKPFFEAFSLAFLESHYRALNATGKLRSLLSGNFAARQTTTTTTQL